VRNLSANGGPTQEEILIEIARLDKMLIMSSSTTWHATVGGERIKH
jgi:hypothetical protein